jgi:hypothetical protein
MPCSWQTETGHLACHWHVVVPPVPYSPSWMPKSSELQSSYLPPLPRFTAHSPFGGASWFRPYLAE